MNHLHSASVHGDHAATVTMWLPFRFFGDDDDDAILLP